MATNELGRRISELLLKYDLSQRDLAKLVGVTEVSMSRYISGDRRPKDPILANIAMHLHTTPEYLLNQEIGDEDSELASYRPPRAIARNAKNWSTKQKTDLVNALFGEE